MNAGVAVPTLTPEAVHVWRIPLNNRPPPESTLSILTTEERQRAARFVNPDHRHTWQQCRIAVRQILARYCHEPPAAIHFVPNAYGKPRVTGVGPEFNLSHTGSAAALAIAATEIGIDIEDVSRPAEYVALAQRFFSPAEASLLADEKLSAQATTFFQIWTRKEAYIKARGMGLSIPLDAFRVDLRPGCRVDVSVDWDDNRSWYCHSIPLTDKHITSLVCGHAQLRLHLFEWESLRCGR